MKKVAGITIVFLLFCTTVFAQKIGKEILAAHNKFQKLVLERDSINIGSLYTDEAVSMRQNEPIRKGRTAIVGRWSRAFRMSFSLHMSMQQLFTTSPTTAYQYGTFEVKSTDPEPVLLASGKWIICWRKERGEWKIELEMDSFNASR